MKRFIVIAVILICCLLLYAIVKLSMSEYQNVNDTTEEKQITKQINAGNTDKATPAEETQSAKQINADNTDKATSGEDPNSDSARSVVQVDVPAAQVEAVIKAFSEFKSAIKSEDYEQAWKLTSEFFKSKGSFEDFKKDMPGERIKLANAAIHPESATNIEGRVRLLVTSPEDELYLSFIQEDGQWKLYGGRSAQSVDNSKE